MRHAILILSLAMTLASHATHLHTTFNDLVSNAHVILVGTCVGTTSALDPERQGIVGSIAYFTELEVIRTNRVGSAPGSDTLAVPFLGGRAEGVNMSTCDMPQFVDGKRYLLFLLNDGTKYINPLVGGAQGHFRVLLDEHTGEPCLIDAGGHGLVQFDGTGILKTRFPVMRISDGRPELDLGAAPDSHTEIDLAPETWVDELPLLTLSEVAQRINAHSFVEPSFNALRANAVDMPSTPANPAPGPQTPWDHRPSMEPRGTLGACMHQDVYLWFEQNDAVPGFSSWAAIDDYCKYIWDVHINIYSDDPNPTNGFYPDNNSCEIAGWLSSSELSTYYGYSWGGALAMCVYWYSGSEIVEADIMFNEAYAWTDDWNVAFQGTAVDYRNVMLHEMGHSWGYQAGSCYPETYDYAYPSVMHAYHDFVWENGLEIHARDAQIIRANYDNQATIKDVDDIGVESYRALSGTGLVDGYASDYNVPSGQNVTVHRVTVENCSDDAQSGVRLRLYLSTNRSLNSSDHLVGNYDLGNMSAVTRVIDSYNLDTEGVPPGTYYVGMKVSRGGTAYNDDDRPANDVTWSTYQISITGAVGIAERSPINALSVFPNPTEGTVTIGLPEGVRDFALEVNDASGRVLATMDRSGEASSGAMEFDLSEFPAGLYQVVLMASDGRRYFARVARN